MEEYKIIQPHILLSPYISHYWILTSGAKEENVQRIHPTGCMQLLFYFSDKVYSHTHKTWHPVSYLGGQSTTYDDLITTGPTKVLGIVFRPLGARAFFPLSMKVLQNTTVDIHDLGMNWLKNLEDTLHTLQTWEERVEIIEKYFLRVGSKMDTFNSKRLIPSIHMATSQPESGIKEMASISCLSTKQYNRVFSEHVGLNPKEFLRIIRFQRALHTLQTNPTMKLQDVAFDCGYYDLPHLTREFKTFTGYTPTEYQILCAPYSDYFTD